MGEHETSEAAKAPRIGVGRSIFYVCLASILLLGVLEGAAAVLEPWLFPYKRTIPIPAPKAPGQAPFVKHVAELQAELDPSKLPSARRSGIPLMTDATRGWALPANTEMNIGGVVIRGNEVGLRGEDLKPPVEGDVRLFTLGDSSIFGDGVEEVDVFSTVAAGILAQAWGRKVFGIIGACPGHDTAQSLSTLRGLGQQVQPTWVVIGNLWSDLYRREEHGADSYVYLPPVQGVLRRSALYRLLWRALSPWLNARQVRWIESREDVGDVVDRTLRVPLNEYIQNLGAIAQEARRLKARPVFLILPAPMDFDTVPVPDTVQQYRLAIQSVAERVGAPVLDGPALFKERGAGPAYFWDNVHPTAEGHFLLGEGLSALLQPEGPPPEGASHYPPAQGERR